MSAAQAMKRIPRIKFPQRHPQASSIGTSKPDDQSRGFQFGSMFKTQTPSSSGEAPSYRFRSDVPAAPTNTAIGGKASLLPKRTPVSEKEIEAILLGGCF